MQLKNVEAWKIAFKMNAQQHLYVSRTKGLKVLKDDKAFGDVCNGGYLLTKERMQLSQLWQVEVKLI